jgi:hypothetical protein
LSDSDVVASEARVSTDYISFLAEKTKDVVFPINHNSVKQIRGEALFFSRRRLADFRGLSEEEKQDNIHQLRVIDRELEYRLVLMDRILFDSHSLCSKVQPEGSEEGKVEQNLEKGFS